MRINSKILSIPPYISTHWANISAIYMRDGMLIVGLIDGDAIEVPNLELEQIQSIFEIHADFVEEEEKFFSQTADKTQPPFSFLQGTAGNDLQLAFGGIDGFSTMMQHNPEQMNGPDLPNEILDKVSAISKIVTPESSQDLPIAEPHCNCMHCQIARAISGKQEVTRHTLVEEPIEPIEPEELQFQQWDIVQTEDKMYTVTNRLDNTETFNVYLGKPIGCTCGKEGCEHILAVLRE